MAGWPGIGTDPGDHDSTSQQIVILMSNKASFFSVCDHSSLVSRPRLQQQVVIIVIRPYATLPVISRLGSGN